MGESSTKGQASPDALDGVSPWPSVFALVALAWLALATLVAVVLSNYETVVCDDDYTGPAISAFFHLVFFTPILLPISIFVVWRCAVRRDRAYLLWIAVAVGSVIPLAVEFVMFPLCPD